MLNMNQTVVKSARGAEATDAGSTVKTSYMYVYDVYGEWIAPKTEKSIRGRTN